MLFYAASRHHLPALAVERGQKVVEKYPKHIVLKRLIAVALAELNGVQISCFIVAIEMDYKMTFIFIN